MSDRVADPLEQGLVVRVRQTQARQGRASRARVHDDLVRRSFTTSAANQLWLADITEHRTRKGKLYLCGVKDVYSNRIVGSSIDSRMKARPALENAIARRGDVAGRVVHTDRGSQFRNRKFVRVLSRHAMAGSAGAPVLPVTTQPRSPSSRC